MVAQYLTIKEAHPDYLLFYRMGDFYELFFDDAVQAAAALDITLTKRGKHRGDDIPMCGVPVHAADTYLSRLIRKGFKVAVCEQVEEPAEAKKRGSKALVRRDVIRLVTQGTLTEETLLDARDHNFLAALAEAENELAVAWLDMSTGDFHVQAITEKRLPAVLARIDPGEVLLSDHLFDRPEMNAVLGDSSAVLSPLPPARFDSTSAKRRLEAVFGVRSLEGFGHFSRAEVAACGALIDYVELTQKGRLPRLAPPRRLRVNAVLEIDAATRRNLELARSFAGGRKGSLLDAIDRTVTGAGARLLAVRLASPLTGVAAIERRLDMVQFFFETPASRERLREALKRSPDLERALSRLTLGRGSPRDLAGVRDALALTQDLRDVLSGESLLPDGLADQLAALGSHGDLVDELERALQPELPTIVREGGFIAPGYSPELDETLVLRDESRRLIAGLEARYGKETGIGSLKIRHNNLLGYYIEVTAAHAAKLTAPESGFLHRQTMANAARFTTVELSELEGRIRQAADRALALENALFDVLVAKVADRAEAIAAAAAAMAECDVAAALGELAVQCRYVRPAIEEGLAFDVVGGRHPVVERALERDHEAAFVENDCNLGEGQRLWLVTGPNMAGKSTFLRQNALIVVLAQMGAFVPARSARLGIVDQLFSRVGAADDLARGRSTFMVEMVETAAILHQAGPRSLVILDEIGRGTATYDGLSIAWAAIEHLHEVNGARTLFATHYHELTGLAAKLENLSCHTMRIKEWQDDVIFLHEVGAGAADRSYGIHVGRLAGLPAAVVGRAEEILKTLEAGEGKSALTRLADDLPLFRAEEPAAVPAPPSPVETLLRDVRPDELSPKAALELLYRLKAALDE
ncbi:MAG: DNA mismatch repair protein MutS [Alphaproteobacteria bacterium]|nr:DNA mismatch repair protein MutS [Alphaproteobacteria bacterium]